MKHGGAIFLVLEIFVYSALSSRTPFHHELIIALGKQGSKAKSAVPLLLKTYEKTDESTHLLIIQTWGKIGPDAKEAIPFLNGLLQSENAQIRGAAARAIEAITQSKR